MAGRSVPDPSNQVPPVGLLARAGFEKGDFLPLYNFNPNGLKSISFTDTTYAFDNGLSNCRLIWDDAFPAGVTVQIFGQAEITVGAGETVSVRIYNYTDSETIVEKTGIGSSQFVSLGPTTYTPPTTGSGIMILWEWKEDVGTNASDIKVPHTCFGVKV